jgi:hypothetical protein
MTVLPTHCDLKTRIFEIATKHYFILVSPQTWLTSSEIILSATVPNAAAIFFLYVVWLALED